MNRGYEVKRAGGVMLGTFPEFDALGIVTHGMSTRRGGVSKGPYRSLNLAYNSEDDPASVMENYQIFTDSLGINQAHAVLSHQTHDTNIMTVTAKDMGKGLTKPKDYESVDGLITNVPGIPLFTFHADCVPIFFVDPVTKVIGLAHAGWKGTLNQMAVKMVIRMQEAYGVNPAHLMVAIGPSIAECCFVIRNDVRQPLIHHLPFTKNMIRVVEKNQWSVSLQRINRSLLVEAGVNPAHIIESGVCTCCQCDLYFSHRAQGNVRGTMAAMLQLNQIRKDCDQDE